MLIYVVSNNFGGIIVLVCALQKGVKSWTRISLKLSILKSILLVFREKTKVLCWFFLNFNSCDRNVSIEKIQYKVISLLYSYLCKECISFGYVKHEKKSYSTIKLYTLSFSLRRHCVDTTHTWVWLLQHMFCKTSSHQE